MSPLVKNSVSRWMRRVPSGLFPTSVSFVNRPESSGSSKRDERLDVRLSIGLFFSMGLPCLRRICQGFVIILSYLTRLLPSSHRGLNWLPDGHTIPAHRLSQPVKVLMFDFDGTIADSFDTVLAIANHLAAEFGYPTARPEDVEYLKDLSSREILKRSQVPWFKLPFLLLRLRVELNREVRTLTLIPGMKEALLKLKQQGHRLGIVTSNSHQNVSAFLDAQELRHLFDFIGSGLTLFGKGKIIQKIMRRYHLNREAVVYVGDETRDIEAARKVGIPIIAVSWGFNSSQALAEQHPDVLIHQPSELVELMRPLTERLLPDHSDR